MGVGVSVTEPELKYTNVYDTHCRCEINENGEKIWHCSQFVSERFVTKKTYGIPFVYQISQKQKISILKINHLTPHSDKDFQRMRKEMDKNGNLTLDITNCDKLCENIE